MLDFPFYLHYETLFNKNEFVEGTSVYCYSKTCSEKIDGQM